MAVEDMIRKFVSRKINGTDCFIVDIKVSQDNNAKVFIDSDEGITIDKCAEVNRYLRNKLEEEGIDYGLQVSSPGITEPLKVERQYYKYIGERVEVRTKKGGRKKGKLLSVDHDQIVVEEKKRKKQGKKKLDAFKTKEFTIPFEDIKSTRLILKF